MEDGRIAIPSMGTGGRDGERSGHFGHCDVFTFVDVEGGEVKQVTETLNPEIDTADLVASEVARFPARDGMVIPGPLYKPIGASAENKVPVMLWIHGGPGGQSRAGYSAEKQFLLNKGYALFAVNNRGSSGYGKSFLAADDGKHGREPLWDCVDAKEYLKTLDWVDPDRIGIMGGSYGGYMTLAALAFAVTRSLQNESSPTGAPKTSRFGSFDFLTSVEKLDRSERQKTSHFFKLMASPDQL